MMASTSAMVVSVERILTKIDVNIRLGVLHVLINDGEHGLWALMRLVDLEEWMIMGLSLFAHGTVVEVLADTALVANSLDRVHATTIADDIFVDDAQVIV